MSQLTAALGHPGCSSSASAGAQCSARNDRLACTLCGTKSPPACAAPPPRGAAPMLGCPKPAAWRASRWPAALDVSSNAIVPSSGSSGCQDTSDAGECPSCCATTVGRRHQGRVSDRHRHPLSAAMPSVRSASAAILPQTFPEVSGSPLLCRRCSFMQADTFVITCSIFSVSLRWPWKVVRLANPTAILARCAGLTASQPRASDLTCMQCQTQGSQT